MKLTELTKIIKSSYEEIPYHNFWYIIRKGFSIDNFGGICTDKSFNLYKLLLSKGYSVSLHSAKINGESTHQLIFLEFEKQNYLIDVGLGWPIMVPIPLFENSKFKAFGVEYESNIIEGNLHLFRLKDDKQIPIYITSNNKLNHSSVMNEFEFSYDESINYPFKKSIRFSKIVNGEFYFLHGDMLFFSNKGILSSKHISSLDMFEKLFEELFLFDVNIAREVAFKLDMFN